MRLTTRQAEVLLLAAGGLCRKQIARHLGISPRTVQSHFSGMRQRTGMHSDAELMAHAVMSGLVWLDNSAAPQVGQEKASSCHPVPETADSGTAATMVPGQESRPGNQSRNGVPPDQSRDGIRDDPIDCTPPAFGNSIRIGYARVSTRAQDHQAQLDALAAAHCRKVIVETASTRDVRPKLRRALGMLHAGDTLVIYKPDRVARSMKELLFLLEDQLRARRINLHILSGISAGLHRPDGAVIADTMLFTVAAMAAEMECDLIRERTLDGLRAARTQGRPAAVNDGMLAIARARRGRGESVTAIAVHLGVGRSTLYRALDPGHNSAAPLVLRAADKVHVSAETLLFRTGWPHGAAPARARSERTRNRPGEGEVLPSAAGR
jgi:DNA invertase Pin-like site-specific DNA recombinase